MDATEIDSGDSAEISSHKRLCRAWYCICQQYLEKSNSTSKEEGAGINIFRFKRDNASGTTRDGSPFNCEYYYDIKDGLVWKSLLDISPCKQDLLEKYDNDTHFLVTVQVPVGESGENTIGDIRMFKFDTFEEVKLHKD